MQHMRSLFISDLHLSPDRPEIMACFIAFIDELSGQNEHVYILGDLFEVWIGDDAVLPEHMDIIHALAAFVSRQGRVNIMHGNRDFLLSDVFMAQSGCRLIADPTLIQLAGQATLLSHGDALCTDDHEYQQYRAHLRQDTFKKEFLALPIQERLRIAREHRRQSQEHNQGKTQEIMDVNQAEVARLMTQYNAVRLIHGHTHRPDTHHFLLDGNTVERRVLPDWYDAGRVLICEDGSFSHQKLITQSKTA